MPSARAGGHASLADTAFIDIDAGRWGHLRVEDPHGHGLDFLLSTNSGHYSLLLGVRDVFEVPIRGLRALCRFVPGCYVEIGTMKKGLIKRVARHLVREKSVLGVWHIDKLTVHPRVMVLGAVLVPHDLWTEHSLNQAIGERLGLSVPIRGFASADCNDPRCEAHLWRAEGKLTLSEVAKVVSGVVATLADSPAKEKIR